MNSGSVNGALGLSDRTDAIQTSRSGDANGKARTSTVLRSENTAGVAPMVSTSVQTTVNANPRWRKCWRNAIRSSFRTVMRARYGNIDKEGTPNAAVEFVPANMTRTTQLVSATRPVLAILLRPV